MSTNADDGEGFIYVVLLGAGLAIVYFWWQIILALAVIAGVIYGLQKWIKHLHWSGQKDAANIVTIVATILFLGGGLYFGKDAYAAWMTPEREITEKQEEVRVLAEKLQLQLHNINETEKQYRQEIAQYTKELRIEKRQKGIASFQGATKSMLQNMSLISEREAYLTKLYQIRTVLTTGLNQATYMYRKLDGDRKMAKVKQDVRETIDEAEDILQKFGKYATSGPVIKLDGIHIKSRQEVWKEYQ